MKYFRMSFDQILWDLSWRNLMMLLATIPVYKRDKDDEKKSVDGIDELGDELKKMGLDI